jgi:uncharacterized protein with FMN-binding domain
LRRVLLALVATTFGLVLLFSYKTQDPARLLDRRPAAYAPSPVGPTVTVRLSTVARKTTTTGRTTTTHARSTGGRTTTTRRATTTTRPPATKQTLTGPVPVEISNYAAPRLRDEALQAQSANIDVVSGATYTSQGYIKSLQAALDSANAD